MSATSNSVEIADFDLLKKLGFLVESGHPPKERLNSPEFLQAVSDFDLSQLESINDSIRCNANSSSVCSVPPIITKSDSLDYRISQIEERLGIFHLIFSRIRCGDLVRTLVSVCREDFNWEVCDRDFVLIHQVNKNRPRGLVQLSSLF